MSWEFIYSRSPAFVLIFTGVKRGNANASKIRGLELIIALDPHFKLQGANRSIAVSISNRKIIQAVTTERVWSNPLMPA